MTIDFADEDVKQETAVAKYRPTAPVQSVRNLKDLLASAEHQIRDVLPHHLTPNRLIKTLLVAANRSPKLLLCTQASVLETVMRSAELGLDLSGTLGEAYPVPYGNKATLIIGYRGLVKLARQSGEIGRIEAEVVCKNDHFEYVKGSDFRLVFRQRLDGDRGEPIGAYALAEYKDGSIQADFMTTDEINRIRNSSQGRNAAPWSEHWDEMAKKTVFRRLSKWLPLSSEKFARALEVDNESFDALSDKATGTLPASGYSPAITIDALSVEELPEDEPESPSAEPETGPEATETPSPVVDGGELDFGPSAPSQDEGQAGKSNQRV